MIDWKEEPKIDVITFIFVLHEIDKQKRNSLLERALHIAKEVVIADYSTPQPFNFYGLLNWMAEAITSKHHFMNFREYHFHNWMEQLYFNNEITIINDLKLSSGSYHIVKIQKNH